MAGGMAGETGRDGESASGAPAQGVAAAAGATGLRGNNGPITITALLHWLRQATQAGPHRRTERTLSALRSAAQCAHRLAGRLPLELPPALCERRPPRGPRSYPAKALRLCLGPAATPPQSAHRGHRVAPTRQGGETKRGAIVVVVGKRDAEMPRHRDTATRAGPRGRGSASPTSRGMAAAYLRLPPSRGLAGVRVEPPADQPEVGGLATY